jgi:purine-cytosine permease-like protein
VAFGGANTFATVVLGTFPILLFGLSFWEGVLAVLLGIVVGGLILAPMALFGPVNGTNNAVSSGAHFGVVGRIVGSFLSLLTAVTFFAISIFTSGDILVGALDRLLGTGQSKALLTVAYALFAVVILVVCLYGFRFMLAVNKVAVITATLLYILGAVAYGPDFDAGFEGTRESFLPAFIGSTLIVMSNPLSFGAFLGDWSRYIPATAPRRQLMLAAFFSQLATFIPFLFGLATASIIAAQASEEGQVLYSVGLVEVTPEWFLVPSRSSRRSAACPRAPRRSTGRAWTSRASSRSSRASRAPCSSARSPPRSCSSRSTRARSSRRSSPSRRSSSSARRRGS